ncbi:MAG: hypothetical protein AAF412_06580 [Pseudomonadota bacterium]
MKTGGTLCLLISAILSAVTLSSASANDFAIKNVTIENLARKHFCVFLGGQSKRPAITIQHTPVPGQKIVIALFDETSDGKTYQHGTKTIKSSSSGTTTVRPVFFPPCNYTGSTSTYQFSVSVGSKSRTYVWGKYNHKQGGIL